MQNPEETNQKRSLKLKLLRLLTGDIGPILALVTIVIFFAAADQVWGQGHFVDIRNLRVVMTETSIVAVAALGMTMIIIAGGIDLSAGTALTLSATVMAYCLRANYPIAVTLSATLVTGCLCGAINGLLISMLRIVPFIVTLGTMTIFLGIGKIIANNSTIHAPRDQIPQWLMNLCSTMPPDLIYGVIPNIPSGVWIGLTLAFLVSVLLKKTVFGRYVFAIGSNEEAAWLSGINIPLMKLGVYTLAGLFVGFAAMYHFATLKIGNPIEGTGLELKFIAAVVIGGGSLNGGRGSIMGTLAGAAIMGVITSGCVQLEVPDPYQNIIIGTIIIIAVTLDRIRQTHLKSV